MLAGSFNQAFTSVSTSVNNFRMSQASGHARFNQDNIKQLKRLLELQDRTPEELNGLAESIAEHAGADVAVVKSMLLVIKTLLELGKLEEKLEAEQTQTVDPYQTSSTLTTQLVFPDWR